MVKGLRAVSVKPRIRPVETVFVHVTSSEIRRPGNREGEKPLCSVYVRFDVPAKQRKLATQRRERVSRRGGDGGDGGDGGGRGGGQEGTREGKGFTREETFHEEAFSRRKSLADEENALHRRHVAVPDMNFGREDIA